MAKVTYTEGNDEKAVPIVWKQGDDIPLVKPGWLLKELPATVRIAQSPLKPGTLFYKPVFMLRCKTMAEAKRLCEELNAELREALSSHISQMRVAHEAYATAKQAFRSALVDRLINRQFRIINKEGPVTND